MNIHILIFSMIGGGAKQTEALLDSCIPLLIDLPRSYPFRNVSESDRGGWQNLPSSDLVSSRSATSQPLLSMLVLPHCDCHDVLRQCKASPAMIGFCGSRANPKATEHRCFCTTVSDFLIGLSLDIDCSSL